MKINEKNIFIGVLAIVCAFVAVIFAFANITSMDDIIVLVCMMLYMYFGEIYKKSNYKEVKEEKYNHRILIDTQEFQSKILDLIGSEEFDRQFATTIFNTYENQQQYRQAMMHGMLLAGIMTCKCELLRAKEKIE